MRTKKRTYLYLYREFIGEFESATQAAQHAGETTMVARNVLSKRCKQTRKGYHYSYTPLTQEEIDNLPIREEKQPKQQPKEKTYKVLYRETENCRWEIESNNTAIFYFPRSRKEKVEMLKQFIYKKLTPIWRAQPKPLSEMEQEFVKDLCKSIV